MENKEIKLEVPPLPKELREAKITRRLIEGYLVEKNINEAVKKTYDEIIKMCNDTGVDIGDETKDDLAIQAYVAYLFLNISAHALNEIMHKYKIETEFNNQ